MKKFSVYLPAFAGASYEVEAKDIDEAIKKAQEICNLDDCTASDWDLETDVQEI